MADYQLGEWIEGQYRVRRIFGGEGKSGMGVVYLVEGRSSEEPFVLKTFQRSGPTDDTLARFKREADAWLKLGRHPNIVPCLWVSEFSGQLFVAAEYVAPDLHGRKTLTDHVKSGSISLAQQVSWIAQFCYGMSHAVSQGLEVHRDIKPDNLMVDGLGRLRITDFGLVKQSGSDLALGRQRDRSKALPSLTEFGTALGTPAPQRSVRASDHNDSSGFAPAMTHVRPPTPRAQEQGNPRARKPAPPRERR